MTSSLYWLTLTVIATALMWLPYVLHGIVTVGIAYLGYPQDPPPPAPWAARAKRAHANAIENLVLFAAVVLIYHAVSGGQPNETVASASVVYFVGRLLHYLVYVLKIPFARTLMFFVGYGATAVVAIQILGAA